MPKKNPNHTRASASAPPPPTPTTFLSLMGWRRKPISLFFLFLSLIVLFQSCSADDASVMQALKKSINAPASLGWTDPSPCKWKFVTCSNNGRVTGIQIGRQTLTGSLPGNLGSLAALQTLEVMFNQLTGPLPSLAGLSSLKTLLLGNNKFTSIPPDFFSGLSGLDTVNLDNNPFSSWSIPENLKDASRLREFSANSANITGGIPVFFGGDTFSMLTKLHLAFNNLEGGLPASFANSQVQSLWLNGQGLNGSIGVLRNMVGLTEVWLHSNSFTGPLPDFSRLTGLQNFSIRDNGISGPVPASLVGISTLMVVNLTNNLLQGPTPKFGPNVQVDMSGGNSFCLSDPGADCGPRVNTLLEVAKSVEYPQVFAQNWKGNDPCTPWPGIVCNNGSIIVVNFQKLGLSGTISPNFSSITSLQRLILASNNLTGTIPNEIGSLPNLKELDVSNNRLYGHVPKFTNGNVLVKTDGNPDFGKDKPSPTPGSTPGGGSPGSDGKKSKAGVIIGSVIGSVCAVAVAGVVGICLYRAKQNRSGRVQSPNGVVIHPRFSRPDHDAVKITIANAGVHGGTTSETHSNGSGGTSDLHVIETGSMVISIQVLKDVTNNFSRENIIGRGGFGTVYKGELEDGTKIAVKRMESGVTGDKGLDEFKSEIAVLTKVRHRHLVSLLGYCLEGNERILVFEYMPQGALSRHLFEWKEEGLKPLEWSKRLIIALDVARGVEYLHGLAHQSFIHRDLKPANILLGDDMRAKVADFGLVRLAPDGKFSVATKLAGTFGYLAPEYAVTGRVTTKIDLYSFGVILMELITGRKALHEGAQNEESIHLVTWFRRMHINKDAFREVIDPTIDLNEETLASVSTVAELACHCTAREPSQRPDMGHAVNVLSSLTAIWKPSDPENEDAFGIDFDMSLPQAVKRWQALEGTTGIDVSSSSFLASGDNSQTSLTPRPLGFADTFRSEDAR